MGKYGRSSRIITRCFFLFSVILTVHLFRESSNARITHSLNAFRVWEIVLYEFLTHSWSQGHRAEKGNREPDSQIIHPDVLISSNIFIQHISIPDMQLISVACQVEMAAQYANNEMKR